MRTVGGEGVAHPLLVDDVDEDAQAQALVLLQPAHLLLRRVVSSTLPSAAATWLPESCPSVGMGPAVSTNRRGLYLAGPCGFGPEFGSDWERASDLAPYFRDPHL